MNQEKKKRIIMAFVGVCLCGFSVGLFKMSSFGTDPFQCFANGIYRMIPEGALSYGTMYTILNLIMLLLIFAINKHYIGIATFINIFGTGYIIDFSMYCLGKVIQEPTLVMRIVLLLLGVVIMCFASSLYYTADLGVSTYDAIALILKDKTPVKFQYCRIGTDAICVLTGFLLKATVGIGTLITAFLMGPLIEFFNKWFSRPLLYKDNQSNS